MKTLLTFAFAITIVATSQARATTLMRCQLSNGGVAQVDALDMKTVQISVDSHTARDLGLSASTLKMTALLESNDPGSVAGPIDILEMSAGACFMNLEFVTNSGAGQPLGAGRAIPLTGPKRGWNALSCKNAAPLSVLGCTAGQSLNSVVDLKKSVEIVVAD